MNQALVNTFSELYAAADPRGETRSGWESTMLYTRSLRDNLPGLLARLGVSSILDAGCGDHNWFSALAADPYMASLTYTGVDCVPQLITDMQSRFPGKDFRLLDICEDSLPQADLMLVRDVTNYLSQDQVLALLNNYLDSNTAWLLITSYADDTVDNPQGCCGEKSNYNLSLSPFNLPPGGQGGLMDFLPGDHARYLVLWTRDQVAEALGRQ